MNLSVAMFLIMLLLVIGEIVGIKTKAFIPSVFVTAVLFLIGFWTFFPKNITTIVGLSGPIITICMLFLIGHMGTLFNIKELISQWKTVVIALSGIAGMCVGTLFIGNLLFGWDTAVIATPPLTGGIVASLMMSEAANAKGLSELAVLSLLVYVMQGFAGYPLTAIALKKEGTRLLKDFREGKVVKSEDKDTKVQDSKFRIFKPLDKKYQTPYIMFLKLSVIAVLAYYGQVITKGAVSQYVIALILGILAGEIGFIERAPLVVSQSFGFFLTGLMVYIFGSLSQATPEMLQSIIVPLVGIIILGVIGMTIVCVIIGKLLGYSRAMSLALSLTALYGFPPNYILTDEAVKSLTDNEDEKKYLMDEMLPKMLIGGFTTVTIVSVVVAGIFINLL